MMASPMRSLLFNKPFRILSRFTDRHGRSTLADFIEVPGVYAAGRLDFDSEGLMILTDDGALQKRISDPKSKLEKTYWAQVEGAPNDEAVAKLRRGVHLNDGPARAVAARVIGEPHHLWPREPPIRFRERIPTHWLEIRLTEGRNRQVRRMTAAVGRPTLRLIRFAIGPWTIEGLKLGEWRNVSVDEIRRLPGSGPG
jgi:23S rRNA pseudouridine2457 synthase